VVLLLMGRKGGKGKLVGRRKGKGGKETGREGKKAEPTIYISGYATVMYRAQTPVLGIGRPAKCRLL